MTLLAVILTAVFILVILVWIKAGRQRKCRNCRHFAEHYITSLQGVGLYRFGYCRQLPTDLRIVEPDIDRGCQYYISGEEVAQDDEEEEEVLPEEDKWPTL